MPISKMCLLVVFFTLLAVPSGVWAGMANNKFPEYPTIRNNIKFWEKIYSVYSVNSAVIHDQNDLTKIYEVVSLAGKDIPHARKINKKIIKHAEKKYTRILLRLAAGARPANKNEVRVAAMFKGQSAAKKMRVAAENVRSQKGLKERFYEGALRSLVYFKRIRSILKAYGLPGDLAYLPHVESSFNPQAYSKSGAAGIWQFTRATGRQYMTINRHVDQRRDPFISTRAAAKLLKKNYDTLGSWPLAITAYNYGTSGMLRATEAHGNYVNIFNNYRQGYFKFASRNFYSEFLAARKVAKRLVGKQLMRIERRSSRPLTVKIITPVRKKVVVSYPSRPIKHIRAQSHPRFYIVKRGDTATSIAAAHNVSVHRLCKENNLGPKAVIRVGQNLKIPFHISSNNDKANLQPSAEYRSRSSALADKVFSSGLCQNIPNVSSGISGYDILFPSKET